jgi:cytochrome P450
MTATPFAPSAAGTDLSDLDLFVAGPPWAAFDSLRQGAPVHWNPEQAPNHGFWSITRHRDVVAVTRDEETFSSQVGATNLEELDAAQLDIRRSMLETDGARHFALRRLLQRDFSARALAPYETFLRGLTATTLDAALTKGGHGALPIDFVREVSADFRSGCCCACSGCRTTMPVSSSPGATGWWATPTRTRPTSCSTRRQ